MSGLKLKVPKLDWKGKALKLQRIVLSGAPLVEVPREVLDMFDFMRNGLRGELSEDARAPKMDMAAFRNLLMWEPYSGAKGKEESVYGWDVQATLYCADSKPWWLVRAHNKLAEPSERSIVELERVVDCLGAHVDRDRIMNMSFGGDDGYSMFWTWINQLPLLEVQIRKNPYDFRMVVEGSPLPPNYIRIERPTSADKSTI